MFYHKANRGSGHIPEYIFTMDFCSVGNFLFQLFDYLKAFKVHIASLDYVLYSFHANFFHTPSVNHVEQLQ